MPEPGTAAAVFDDLAALFEGLAPSTTSSDRAGETLPATPGEHTVTVALADILLYRAAGRSRLGQV